MLLMDDSAFDRQAVRRLLNGSRFDIDVIEASSIADARAALAETRPDIVFLDYRVPDGDGISFSSLIADEFGNNAPPVVIITGEGDEGAAVRTLRAGAVDYLAKDGLSVEAFDGSIERCLAARPVNKTDLMNEIDARRAELERLRRGTVARVQAARSSLVPVTDLAWRWVGSIDGAERRKEAERLARISRELSGALDDTLIQATTEDSGQKEVVDLGQIVQTLANRTPEVADYLSIERTGELPRIPGNRAQLHMLMRELLTEALTSTPPERAPHVRVYPARDQHGAPLLCITDNGATLAERQEGLRSASDAHGRADLPAPANTVALRLSICQRLAEANGGQLRMADAPGGGCTVMLRFPGVT